MKLLNELKDMKQTFSKLESAVSEINSISYAHERPPILNEAAEISLTGQARRIRNATAYGGRQCYPNNTSMLCKAALKWHDSFKYLYALPFDVHAKITHQRAIGICNLRGDLIILNPE